MDQKRSCRGKSAWRFSRQDRIYLSGIGQFGQVVFEAEYESLAEYEKTWATWFARPATADAMKEWLELVRPGGTNEIWELVE